jgi:hypothetical protein
MEFEGIYAYHESGCSLEICQWCGGPSFEVSLDAYLPQIPRRDRSYRSNESFMEAQFTVSAGQPTKL